MWRSVARGSFKEQASLSFVANKKNKQWKELALDTKTKEIVGVYVGERSRNGSQGLWQSLPPLPLAVRSVLYRF